MKIHAYIIAYNEEAILPFVLDHYSSFCEKIIVYDNNSNDGSDEIYKRYKSVKVIKWYGQEINELWYLQIKNEAYKASRAQNADFVIVCDCDELLYHPELLKNLKIYKKLDIDMPLIKGFEMICDKFPVYDGTPITELVKEGCANNFLNKNIVFNPKKDVKFGIGCHTNESPDSVKSQTATLMLLHYKFLSKDYVANRYDMLEKRLSKFNKDCGFGHLYNIENAKKTFDDYFSKKQPIIK